MSQRSSWLLASGCAALLACLSLNIAVPSRGAPPASDKNKAVKTAPKPPPTLTELRAQVAAKLVGREYTGSKHCIACHAKQSVSWSKTKHGNAFTDLPARYQSDANCLRCHVTGWERTGGYVTGADKALLSDLQDVGCEACHGPGSAHEKAAKAFVDAKVPTDELEQAIATSIFKTRPDNACIDCHQGHNKHPSFEGRKKVDYGYDAVAMNCTSSGPGNPAVPCPATGLTSSDNTGVKLCASCHYDQYRDWRGNKHSLSLTSMLPKYWTDKKCLSCHQTGTGKGEFLVTGDVKPARNLLMVGCESCHGPGKQHVQFTAQHIAGPRLPPDLEATAKQKIALVRTDVNACVQCHVSMVHGDHPKYDKPAAAAPVKPAK